MIFLVSRTAARCRSDGIVNLLTECRLRNLVSCFCLCSIRVSLVLSQSQRVVSFVFLLLKSFVSCFSADCSVSSLSLYFCSNRASPCLGPTVVHCLSSFVSQTICLLFDAQCGALTLFFRCFLLLVLRLLPVMNLTVNLPFTSHLRVTPLHETLALAVILD